MKAIRPFQSSLGNHYEDSPSSEEDNDDVVILFDGVMKSHDFVVFKR